MTGAGPVAETRTLGRQSVGAMTQINDSPNGRIGSLWSDGDCSARPPTAATNLPREEGEERPRCLGARRIAFDEGFAGACERVITASVRSAAATIRVLRFAPTHRLVDPQSVPQEPPTRARRAWRNARTARSKPFPTLSKCFPGGQTLRTAMVAVLPRVVEIFACPLSLQARLSELGSTTRQFLQDIRPGAGQSRMRGNCCA